MELGKKIKALRFKAGLTQEALAERLGVVPQSVSKWENGATMPDIAMLPALSEIFGVSIDDLFDLSAEQRLNRIENRLNVEEELPQDIFLEYEAFLKEQLDIAERRKQATTLLATLYWHRMETYSRKSAKYAKDVVRMAPKEKSVQWILEDAAGYASWDWNVSNHVEAIAFYRQLVQENPEARMAITYLVDNLLADHRADEAEEYLNRFENLGGNPILAASYRARLALERFDVKEADEIIACLLADYPDDDGAYFEVAQYYARKGDLAQSITLYEKSFEMDSRRPRFYDALQGIADIYQLQGDYASAANTYARIVNLLEKEWGFTEEIALKEAKEKQAALQAKAK